MCITVFSINQHKQYPVILIANRDEFYDRPTETADYWKENPYILGGRDLKGRGTWLGVNRLSRPKISVHIFVNFFPILTSLRGIFLSWR